MADLLANRTASRAKELGISTTQKMEKFIYNKGMPTPADTEIFSRLAQEILQATEQWHDAPHLEDTLPSAADLARRLNYRLDTVKKKLRVLKENELIQPVSMTPKRYRFNRWALTEIPEDNPLFPLFCDPESFAYIEPDHHNHPRSSKKRW